MRWIMDDVEHIDCDRCGKGVSVTTVWEFDGKELCNECHDEFEEWIEAGIKS